MFCRNALLAFYSLSSSSSSLSSFNRKYIGYVSRDIPRLFPSNQLSPIPFSSALFLSDRSASDIAPIMFFPSQKEAQEYVSNNAKTLTSTSTSTSASDGETQILKTCGDLACQHDSFLQTLSSAKIVSCASYKLEETKPNKNKSNNNNKKKIIDKIQSSSQIMKKAQHAPSNSHSAAQSLSAIIVYAIVLTDSVFFPEGGGQFADHGTLTLTSKATAEQDTMDEQKIHLLVQDVQNVNEVCVLLCRLHSDSNSEEATIMLADTDNLHVEQTIDWDRRFDQMTQHSGQHLCSAVALSDFDIGTHTFSLGPKMSYIDFIIPESWDKEYAMNVFAQIEQTINAHIRDNVPMKPQWLQRTDPLFETKVRSRLLPDGLKGLIRLVEIGNGIDFNTCCGTHVPSLGHLQMIKFFRMEKVKPTIFRVYFASAKRLISIMEDMYDTQAKLTSMISCTDTEQVQRVTQLLDDKRDREKEIRMLNDKLSTYQANETIDQCRASEVNVAIVDLGDVDMGYMTLVSTKALEMGNENDVYLFIGGGGCGEDNNDGSFLLVGDKSIVDRYGKQVAEMFHGRGGGRNGKFQGKGSCVRSCLKEVEVFLKDMIVKSRNE